MMLRDEEPEPDEDEDEFFYSLNRQSAKRQDTSFTRVAIGGIAGVFLLTPLAALLLTPLGIFGWILMFIAIPIAAILGVVFGGGAAIAWNALAARYFSRTDD